MAAAFGLSWFWSAGRAIEECDGATTIETTHSPRPCGDDGAGPRVLLRAGRKTAAAIAKTGTWKLAIVKHARLDQPQSAPRPRLRAIRRGVHPSRNDPHHAPTPDRHNFLLLKPNFLDRLSDLTAVTHRQLNTKDKRYLTNMVNKHKP